MTQETHLIQDLKTIPFSAAHTRLGVIRECPKAGVVRELACRLEVQELLSPGSLFVQNVFRNAHTRRVQGQHNGKKIIKIS